MVLPPVPVVPPVPPLPPLPPLPPPPVVVEVGVPSPSFDDLEVHAGAAASRTVMGNQEIKRVVIGVLVLKTGGSSAGKMSPLLLGRPSTDCVQTNPNRRADERVSFELTFR